MKSVFIASLKKAKSLTKKKRLSRIQVIINFDDKSVLRGCITEPPTTDKSFKVIDHDSIIRPVDIIKCSTLHIELAGRDSSLATINIPWSWDGMKAGMSFLKELFSFLKSRKYELFYTYSKTSKKDKSFKTFYFEYDIEFRNPFDDATKDKETKLKKELLYLSYG